MQVEQAKLKIHNFIKRLENMLNIHTLEVIQELKGINELLEESKDEIKTEPTVSETEWQEKRDIEKKAKQYLKEKEVSNRKFLKGQKAIDKAIELGFSI